ALYLIAPATHVPHPTPLHAALPIYGVSERPKCPDVRAVHLHHPRQPPRRGHCRALPFGAATIPMGTSPHHAGRPCSTVTSTRRRSEEHTSELQSRENIVCRLLLEKK